MKTILWISAALFPVFSASAAHSATYTMEFEGLPVSDTQNATTPSTSYTEDGMTMDPVGHYDAYRTHPSLSPDPTNRNPVIHEGNTGSRVDFTYAGGAFDLISLDVIGWFFNGPSANETTTVSFASSSGGLHTISASESGANFTGLVNFTALAGFSSITSFSIFLPNPGSDCAIDDCPNFSFDNVVFQAPPSTVPLPASVPLLLAGLGGIFALGRRRLTR